MEIFCRWWQLKPALYPERLDFASNSNLRWCRWWWYIGMLMLISACWCWFCWSTVTLKYYSLGLVHLLGFFLFLKISFNLTFPSHRIGFVSNLAHCIERGCHAAQNNRQQKNWVSEFLVENLILIWGGLNVICDLWWSWPYTSTALHTRPELLLLLKMVNIWFWWLCVIMIRIISGHCT